MHIINPAANLSPKPPTREVTYRGFPRTRKPATKQKVTKKSVPGACHLVDRNTWRAYYYDGNTTAWLGEHKSPERALLAVRLYEYWKRTEADVPTKPSRRLYVKHKVSDYS